MKLLYLLEGIRNPALDFIMGAVTHLGGEIVFMAAAIVVFWCVNKRCGYYMLTTGLAGTLINQFLKIFFKVPRPWVKDPEFTIVESARADAGGYSFPSGHTQNAFAVLGAPGVWIKRRWSVVLGGVLVLLVALSRMYLGVHTPLDVGVSLVIGVVLTLALCPIFRDMDEKPGRVAALFWAFIAAAALFVLYVSLADHGADVDLDQLAHAKENAWMLLFCATGLMIVWQVDKRFIRFPVKAPFWAQAVKVIVGLGGVMLIKALLKAPLLELMNGHSIANGIRYFIMILFAGIVWPLTFKWFAKFKKD